MSKEQRAAEKMMRDDASYLAQVDATKNAAFEEFSCAEYEAEWGFSYEGFRTFRLYRA